jgi:hypothetical protein
MGDASSSVDLKTIRGKDGTARRELEFCVLKSRSYYNYPKGDQISFRHAPHLEKANMNEYLRPQKEDVWIIGRSLIGRSYYLLTAVFLSKPSPLYINQPETLVDSGI